MVLVYLTAVRSVRMRALINLEAAGQVYRGYALSWVTFLGLSASMYGPRYIFNAVSCPGEEGERELLSSVRRAVASIAWPRHALSGWQERKMDLGPCCFPLGCRGRHRLVLQCALSLLLSSNTQVWPQLDPGVAPDRCLRLCEWIVLKWIFLSSPAGKLGGRDTANYFWLSCFFSSQIEKEPQSKREIVSACKGRETASLSHTWCLCFGI